MSIPLLIKPSPYREVAISADDAVKLCYFLQPLTERQSFELFCLDIHINKAHSGFKRLSFAGYNSNTDTVQVYELAGAETNTALMEMFNSFYLLHRQRKKKERQVFSPSFWIEQLEQQYGLLAYLRKRKLRLLLD